jgi:hypothetical protein
MEGKGSYPGLLSAIITAMVCGKLNPSRERSPCLRLGTKGITGVPLDGAARGFNHTRAPARGTTAAPDLSPPAKAAMGALGYG